METLEFLMHLKYLERARLDGELKKLVLGIVCESSWNGIVCYSCTLPCLIAFLRHFWKKQSLTGSITYMRRSLNFINCCKLFQSKLGQH